MDVRRVGDGLWRWTLPHPAWKPEFDRPDGWGRLVASVYAETERAIVLIDPLLPGEGAELATFWSALDRDVARVDRPIAVLVGSVDHGRSADAIAARYRAAGREVAVVGDDAIRESVSCTLDVGFDRAPLGEDVAAIPLAGTMPGEHAIVLRSWRAAVFADAVIGAGDGAVRVAPPSWGVRTPEGRARYDAHFRASLGRVLALDPDILLPSHGEPVVGGGGAALAAALAAPAWGA